MLWSRLENNKTAVSQIRNLKTTTFTESHTTDMLILAAAVHNLCLWSFMVCRASPYLTSLCLSLWACHFPLLLLLSFPPRPRRPRVCSLAVGLLGGWGGGVYLVGAALLCPHHSLLWNSYAVGSHCGANNNKIKKKKMYMSQIEIEYELLSSLKMPVCFWGHSHCSTMQCMMKINEHLIDSDSSKKKKREKRRRKFHI